MQLHQQQPTSSSVSKATRARTRLAKGTTGDSPLKAHAPTQALAHALLGGNTPPDARTTIAAIPAPRPGAR